MLIEEVDLLVSNHQRKNKDCYLFIIFSDEEDQEEENDEEEDIYEDYEYWIGGAHRKYGTIS